MTYIHNHALSMEVFLYDNINSSSSNKTLNFFKAIPVAALDTAITTLEPLLVGIEYLARSILNLLGTIFSNCKVKNTLFLLEKSLKNISYAPCALALAPVKFIYQACSILRDINTNNTIRSFCYDSLF